LHGKSQQDLNVSQKNLRGKTPNLSLLRHHGHHVCQCNLLAALLVNWGAALGAGIVVPLPKRHVQAKTLVMSVTRLAALLAQALRALAIVSLPSWVSVSVNLSSEREGAKLRDLANRHFLGSYSHPYWPIHGLPMAFSACDYAEFTESLRNPLSTMRNAPTASGIRL